MATAASQAVTANTGVVAPKFAQPKTQAAPEQDSFAAILNLAAPAANSNAPAPQAANSDSNSDSTGANGGTTSQTDDKSGNAQAGTKKDAKADDTAQTPAPAPTVAPDGTPIPVISAVPVVAPVAAAAQAQAGDSETSGDDASELLAAINGVKSSGAGATQSAKDTPDTKDASAKPARGASGTSGATQTSDPRDPAAIKPGDGAQQDAKKDFGDKTDDRTTNSGTTQNQDGPAQNAAVLPDMPNSSPAPTQSANMNANPVTAVGIAAPSAPVPSNVAVSANVTLQTPPTNPTPDLSMMAVAIATKSSDGIKQFDIRLDPPELGRVEVRLSIDDAGKTSAHLTADQPQTLDLLQKDSAGLQQALRNAGLDVAQNGLNFSLRGNTGQDGTGGRGGFSRARSLEARAVQTVEAASTPITVGASTARLDIRV